VLSQWRIVHHVTPVPTAWTIAPIFLRLYCEYNDLRLLYLLQLVDHPSNHP